MTNLVARNLESIRKRIEAAAHRSGRSPEEITLVGVSKTMPVEPIRQAVEAGLSDLGENRVQEAREKIPLLPDGVRWHLVGHLQGNKANHAAALFQFVHSIDSVELLNRLDRAAERAGRTIEGLIQVNLAGERQKTGVPEEATDVILEAASSCRHVTVRGLMILPPYSEEPESMRPYFRRLKEVLRRSQERHPGMRLDRLSMGMTEDFEVAIEEGATIVRIGRALFGERMKT